MLIMGAAVTNAIAAPNSGILPSTDASIEKWVFSSSTFTQEDLNNNFLEYASPEATATLSSKLALNEGASDSANVVGVVLDFKTEKPISEATIYANNQKIVTSGKDGRFQITNMPNGEYDWQISAPGYEDSCYLNYLVDGSDGANIFKFCLDTDNPIIVDREGFHHGEQEIPPESSVDLGTYEASTLSMSSVPSVRSDVDIVDIANPVPRDEYKYTVLSSELYSTSWYTTRGLTSAEVEQLYVAQAIAANTFLEYA